MNSNLVGVLKYEITAQDLEQVIEDVVIKTTEVILAKLEKEHSPEFIPRKEAMKKLNVKSPLTMSRWEEKGYLNPHLIGGRIFYRQDEIKEAFERFKRNYATEN